MDEQATCPKCDRDLTWSNERVGMGATQRQGLCEEHGVVVKGKHQYDPGAGSSNAGPPTPQDDPR